MNPLFELGIFIVLFLLVALISDWLSYLKSKRNASPLIKFDQSYSEAKRTGNVRWVDVKYCGETYRCMQTQWEKWRIEQNMVSGERVVYLDWSTMKEIRMWREDNTTTVKAYDDGRAIVCTTKNQ